MCALYGCMHIKHYSHLWHQQFAGRRTPTYQQQALIAGEFRNNGQLPRENEKESR
jgi:hypothetical protein